jgi:hypothetical protein
MVLVFFIFVVILLIGGLLDRLMNGIHILMVTVNRVELLVADLERFSSDELDRVLLDLLLSDRFNHGVEALACEG